jgi:hypothetical protein
MVPYHWFCRLLSFKSIERLRGITLQIGIKLLSHEYKLPQQTAEYVIDAVWNKMNSRDVRDLLKIAKVVRKNDSLQDIEQLVDVQLKYAADEEETEFN